MKRIKLNKNEKVKSVHLNGMLQISGEEGDYIVDNKGIKFHNKLSRNRADKVTLDITKQLIIK